MLTKKRYVDTLENSFLKNQKETATLTKRHNSGLSSDSHKLQISATFCKITITILMIMKVTCASQMKNNSEHRNVCNKEIAPLLQPQSVQSLQSHQVSFRLFVLLCLSLTHVIKVRSYYFVAFNITS